MKSKVTPMVSVVIPCRNEEKFIGRVLDSLIHGDYPKEKLEILVVDGGSEDRTKVIVTEYAKKHPFIKLLNNPQRTTPIAMNIGIKNAEGELVTKTDAHSIYPKDYISKCVRYLNEYQADAVGGIQRAFPSEPNLSAEAIALSLGSSFGAGGGGLRTGTDKPRWADTAFGICYKKDVVIRAGLFNEKMTRSQDMDLNLRLAKIGAKILLIPITIKYYPKATLGAFFKHNIKDGIWAILPMKYGAPPFKLRHLIPLFFVLGLFGPLLLSIWYKPFIYLTIAVLALYLLASFYFSIRIALGKKKFTLAPFLTAAFAVRHFGYGIGSLLGLVRLIS
jgi:glycosyltransferase involved in cell wall biosynthesis